MCLKDTFTNIRPGLLFRLVYSFPIASHILDSDSIVFEYLVIVFLVIIQMYGNLILYYTDLFYTLFFLQLYLKFYDLVYVYFYRSSFNPPILLKT